MNRFESIVRSVQTTSENLSASRSRIVDADFAAETANLTRAQILQTEPDRAVAKVLRQYRKGIIHKGDRVATRLKVS